MLLGADVDAAYPGQTAQLQPDDLVLFYTDGLVERRTASPDELLDKVRQTLSGVSAEPGDDNLVRLRELLHDASPDDDTCTLAVRVMP